MGTGRLGLGLLEDSGPQAYSDVRLASVKDLLAVSLIAEAMAQEWCVC